MAKNKQVKGTIEEIQGVIEQAIERMLTADEVKGLVSGYEWRKNNECHNPAIVTYFHDPKNMDGAIMFSFDVVDGNVASLIFL